MKKLIQILVVISMVFFSVSLFADTATQTLTFQWEQPGSLTYLKEWKIYWSDKQGGPYDTQEIATIPYSGTPATTYTAAESPVVSGNPGTTVTKYFVIIACGDIPQQDGSTKYECSDNSNEVSHGFWIPVGQFQAPVKFQIIPSQ